MPAFSPDTGPHRRGADLSQMGPVRLQHRAHRGRCCGGVSLRNRLGGSVPGAPALGHSFPSPGRRGHRPALPLERDGAGPGHQSGADGGPGRPSPSVCAPPPHLPVHHPDPPGRRVGWPGGAALQLGGSIGAWVGRKIHLDEKDRRIMVMCGMSAAFSGLFGTPITAAIFAMEVVSVE